MYYFIKNLLVFKIKKQHNKNKKYYQKNKRKNQKNKNLIKYYPKWDVGKILYNFLKVSE